MKRTAFLAATLAVSLPLLASMGQGQTYTITDLGAVSVYAINRQGKVAGAAYFKGNLHAALFSNGKAVDLGTLPADHSSIAYDVNDSNQVVGFSAARAVLFQNGTVTALPMLEGWTDISQGWGWTSGVSPIPIRINRHGDVTGLADGAFGTHLFLYSAGTMQDLGDPTPAGPCGERTTVAGINDYGVIAGSLEVGGGMDCGGQLFFYSGGQFQNVLGPPDCWYFRAIALNDAGQVIGWAYVCTDLMLRFPYRYDAGAAWDNLGLPEYGGAHLTWAEGINNLGQVVGLGERSDGSGTAILWSNGTATDLTTLVPSNSAFLFLGEAVAINDSGQITGYGQTKTGYKHAFMLTPVKTKK